MNVTNSKMVGLFFLCILLPLSVPAADYTGTVRIFMVEPVSQWTDGNGDPYGFGFLDFALAAEIALKNYDVYEQTEIWNASLAGFENRSVSNIMAMVAVFNSDSVETDAFPGHEYWFWAHHVDATAAARPGEIGLNSTEAGFTHTVWVEQSGSGG